MQAQAVMQAQQMPPAPAPPIQKPRDIVLTEEKLQEKGMILKFPPDYDEIKRKLLFKDSSKKLVN